jgi:hypothetical protein
MSDEPTERDVEALDPLTPDEWLAVRRAAVKWAEQVNGAMPGPEPLLGVVQQIKAQARREGAAEVAAKVEALAGEWDRNRHGYFSPAEARRQLRAALRGDA